MQVHLARLEGRKLNGCVLYIPQSTELNSEISELYDMARDGTINTEVAENQINTYLFAAAYLRVHPQYRRPKQLMISITDSPSQNTLPDIGYLIHRVLARDPVPCCISALIEQCIPCFRHNNRQIPYEDSQETIINLVMALLLGLYQGQLRKPTFETRVTIYTACRNLLTQKRETQTEFCKNHEDILTLACMEYISRITPTYLPAQVRKCFLLFDIFYMILTLLWFRRMLFYKRILQWQAFSRGSPWYAMNSDKL